MNAHNRRRLVSLVALCLFVALCVAPLIATAGPTYPLPDGYNYTVLRGDSWSSISRRTGITVAELKALNPAAVRPRDWLWIGERLYIPAQPSLPPPEAGDSPCGYWYQVSRSDSWHRLAQKTGVPLAELWRVNPLQVSRVLWLYTGRWLWIPGPCGVQPDFVGPVAPAPAGPVAAQPAATQAPAAVPPAAAHGASPTLAVKATGVLTPTAPGVAPAAAITPTATTAPGGAPAAPAAATAQPTAGVSAPGLAVTPTMPITPALPAATAIAPAAPLTGTPPARTPVAAAPVTATVQAAATPPAGAAVSPTRPVTATIAPGLVAAVSPTPATGTVPTVTSIAGALPTVTATARATPAAVAAATTAAPAPGQAAQPQGLPIGWRIAIGGGLAAAAGGGGYALWRRRRA